MNEKNKERIKYILIPILMFIVTTFMIQMFLDESWIISIITGLVTSILFFFALKYHWFKDKNKQQEERIEGLVKKLNTPTLKLFIKEQEEVIKIANYEYDKRKDKSIKEKIVNQVWNIVDYGIVIFMFGLFMFGGLANLFNVNNEFTNPSNSSLGINQSFEYLEHIGVEVTSSFMNVGTTHPSIFFWMFWLVVIIGLIIPIFKIIYYIIKKLVKKE